MLEKKLIKELYRTKSLKRVKKSQINDTEQSTIRNIVISEYKPENKSPNINVKEKRKYAILDRINMKNQILMVKKFYAFLTIIKHLRSFQSKLFYAFRRRLKEPSFKRLKNRDENGISSPIDFDSENKKQVPSTSNSLNNNFENKSYIKLVKNTQINIGVKSSNFTKLPSTLKVFFRRFSNNILQDFGKKSPANSKILRLDDPQQLNIKQLNDNSLKNWMKTLQRTSDDKFIESLGFCENYRFLFSGMSNQNEISHKDLFQIIRQIIKTNFRSYILIKINSKKNIKQNCFEIALMMFLFHLNIPSPLQNALGDRRYLMLILIICSFCFKTKPMIRSAKYFSDLEFEKNNYFDVKLKDQIDLQIQKSIYFCVWNLKNILNEFVRLSPMEQIMNHKLCFNLLNLERLKTKKLIFTENLSTLIKSIKYSDLLKFYLCFSLPQNLRKVKKQNIRETRDQKRECKIDSFNHCLNTNEMASIKVRALQNVNIPNYLLNRGIKKIKKNQEISTFLGTRIKNYILKHSSKKNYDHKTNISFFSISKTVYNSFYLSRKSHFKNDKNFSFSEVNRLINKKLLYSSRTPLYLFQCLKLTDQYRKHSKSFFQFHFLADEMMKFFNKKSIVSNKCNFKNICEMLFVSKPKCKIPWSNLELLKSIEFANRVHSHLDFRIFSC